MSFDRGFGDLRAYPPGTHPGIVGPRLRSQDLASVTAALGLLLGYEDLDDIGGATVILSDSSVRIRRSPPA